MSQTLLVGLFYEFEKGELGKHLAQGLALQECWASYRYPHGLPMTWRPREVAVMVYS